MRNELIAYYALRFVLGLLGIALPIILVVWGFVLCECIEIQDSISDYYSLRTRDALVGILFAMAIFMGTYRGYPRRPQVDHNLLMDNEAGFLACIFALGVAFFPNSGNDLERYVHFISATGLFVVFAYFCLFLFTKSRAGAVPRGMKIIRNKLYLVCGIVICVCIGLMFVNWAFDNTSISDIKPLFWLESVALWAFGTSWIVKGAKVLPLFRDREAETT